MEAPENSLRDGLAAALKELNEGHIEIAERMNMELTGRGRPIPRPTSWPRPSHCVGNDILRPSDGLFHVLLYVPSMRRQC